MSTQGSNGEFPQASERIDRGFWRRLLRNRRASAGALILFCLSVLAGLAPAITPFPAEKQFLAERLEGPSRLHPMGTDGLGRDVLSRAVIACRVSLAIGISAMIVSMIVGVGIGMTAGYLGGPIDNILMRFTDLVLAFPIFFLLLTVLAIFGRSIAILILVIGITAWGPTARVVRGQVLVLREMGFVEAARSLGASEVRIMVRHILPNTVPVIVVAATLRVAFAILAEGGLSFLGLGVPAPTPSWGNMIAEGREFLRVAWWVSVFPGALLFLCVMAFNLVGDGLREAFDPRMIYA